MKFCDNCGSYLKQTREGYWCPKCHKTIASTTQERRANPAKRNQETILAIGKGHEQQAKSPQTCPRCGNREAYYWFSTASGEHAGVRQERTVEHFKCIKCSHAWTRSY